MTIRGLLVLALLFLGVRAFTTVSYRDTLYYYGLVAHQFAIADGAFHGHGFAHDPVRSAAAFRLANREQRLVPLEEWPRLESSGRYETFPAVDLPGYGYLIAATSRWAGGPLTTRYAMAVQVGVELLGLLLFVVGCAVVFGSRVGFLSGIVYVFAFPFIWPLASLPMRDVFLVGFYGAYVAAFLVFSRARGVWWLMVSGTLIGLASVLLWIRPHGYAYAFCLSPLALLVRQRSVAARIAFAGLLVSLPWAVFGLPLRAFNQRHYGVANTDAVGRTLWEHMGIVEGNPYGFVMRDEAMLPWIKATLGRDVSYGSPEMNRLLGEQARHVIRQDPVFYLRAVALHCGEMAKTPLDFVPPFRLVEFATSGLSLSKYAWSYPGAFAFKLANRVLVLAFFYGGLLLALRAVRRFPSRRLDLAVLLSPLPFTMLTQALLHFEARYMAPGAWVLVLPMALGIEEVLVRWRAAPAGSE